MHSMSKERLEGNIETIGTDLDKIKSMMKDLSQLTSAEVDELKLEFEDFKKKTATEVKNAWKEVEAHERELKRQQEMYRSMLTEYYSALESRKAIEMNSLKMSFEINKDTPLPITDVVPQINIGDSLLNIQHNRKYSMGKKSPSNLQNIYHNNSMTSGRASKAKGKFPKIGSGSSNSSKKMISTTLNFSPSIRNHSEMRQTMKGILNTEEKQYQVLRKFVKYSPKAAHNTSSFKQPTEFRYLTKT